MSENDTRGENRIKRPIPKQVYNEPPKKSSSGLLLGAVVTVAVIGLFVVGGVILFVIALNSHKSTTVNDGNTIAEGSSVDDGTTVETEALNEASEPEYATLNIEHLLVNSSAGSAAEILNYSGNIGYEGQVDTYNIEPQYSGSCRIDISNMLNEARVALILYDDMGNIIASDSYCHGESGITGEVEEGRTYSVTVEQCDGNTGYELNIGMPKAPADLTGITEYLDSISYIDQCNDYYFTAPVSGLYRFEFSEMYSDTAVGMILEDHLGYKAAGDGYCKNGTGVEAKELIAGETYHMQITQVNACPDFRLTIWYPKEKVNIAGYTAIRDSIQYEDQCNVYEFVVPESGDYNFKFNELQSDTALFVYMTNYLGEDVGSNTYCKNNEGFSVKGLKAGEVYEIFIEQINGLTDYYLMIESDVITSENVDESGTVPLNNGNVVEITAVDDEKTVEVTPLDSEKTVEIIE